MLVGSIDRASCLSHTDPRPFILTLTLTLSHSRSAPLVRQYAALRRKIGGTAKDYWKDWVEVKGEYTDKGYVAKDEGTSVPALGFLVIVVVALLGTTAAVVTQF